MNIEKMITALDDPTLWSMYNQISMVIGDENKNPTFYIWYEVFKIVDDEINRRLAAEFDK